MFQGKVYYYKNVNGRERRFEKEFSDAEEYREFVRLHPELRFGNPFDVFSIGFPRLGEYLDDAIRARFAALAPTDETEDVRPDKAYLPEGVDLGKYARELRDMEAKKQEKDIRRKNLEADRTALLHYRESFTTEGREDMVTSIDEDIRKIDAEIAQL